MDDILAEIERAAERLTAALRKLPDGPHRNIAISQIGEAVRLAESAAEAERARTED